MKKEEKKQYNFRIEPSIMNKVEDKARKKGWTVSLAIRMLLRNYIKK